MISTSGRQLEIIEIVVNAVDNLAKFTWDANKDTVREHLTEVLDAAAKPLFLKDPAHRAIQQKIMEQITELEKPWGLKVEVESIATSTDEEPVDEGSHWKVATVGWLADPQNFCPSKVSSRLHNLLLFLLFFYLFIFLFFYYFFWQLKFKYFDFEETLILINYHIFQLPKMKVPKLDSKSAATSGIYDSPEDYFNTIIRLWTGVTFHDGWCALTPSCRWKDQDKDCRQTLWPCDNRDLLCGKCKKNHFVMACPNKRHPYGLCEKCATAAQRDLRGHSSTDIYDATVTRYHFVTFFLLLPLYMPMFV